MEASWVDTSRCWSTSGLVWSEGWSSSGNSLTSLDTGLLSTEVLTAGELDPEVWSLLEGVALHTLTSTALTRPSSPGYRAITLARVQCSWNWLESVRSTSSPSTRLRLGSSPSLPGLELLQILPLPPLPEALDQSLAQHPTSSQSQLPGYSHFGIGSHAPSNEEMAWGQRSH